MMVLNFAITDFGVAAACAITARAACPSMGLSSTRRRLASSTKAGSRIMRANAQHCGAGGGQTRRRDDRLRDEKRHFRELDQRTSLRIGCQFACGRYVGKLLEPRGAP